jgi:hypothetical protein
MAAVSAHTTSYPGSFETERALKNLVAVSATSPHYPLFPVYGGTRGPNPALPDASRPTLPDAERVAVQKYTAATYRPLNDGLRDGTPLPPNIQAVHDDVSRAISRVSHFQAPVDVVRGLKFTPAQAAAFVNGFGPPGNVVSLAGYQSTTVGTQPDPFFKGNVQLNVKAIHGLDMSPHTHFPGSPAKELLLAHNTAFKVVGTRVVGGVTHVDLEQMPVGTAATPHKAVKPARAPKPAPPAG